MVRRRENSFWEDATSVSPQALIDVLRDWHQTQLERACEGPSKPEALLNAARAII